MNEVFLVVTKPRNEEYAVEIHSAYCNEPLAQAKADYLNSLEENANARIYHFVERFDVLPNA